MPDRKQQPASSPIGCSLFSRILKSGTGSERSPGFGKRRSTSSCVTSHQLSSLLVESNLPSRFAALLLTEGRLFQDRKSTRLNSSHRTISYAVFCLKKKNKSIIIQTDLNI